MANIEELDKMPISNSYVVSRNRTRNEKGITESSAFLKKYYSVVDAEIYFCNEYVEDIRSIQWSITQETYPLFGYNSYTYDEVAQGARIIKGTFVINFTSPNYLFKLLDRIEENEKTVFENFTVKAKKRIIDGVVTEVFTDNNGIINYPNRKPIWEKTFDIDVIMGHKTDVFSQPVHIVLEGVKLVESSIEMSADGGGLPNVFERYAFVAKDIITKDYQGISDKTNSSSGFTDISVTQSSTAKDNSDSTEGMKNLPKTKKAYYSLEEFEDQGQFGGSYGDLMQKKKDLNIRGVEINHIPAKSQYTQSLVDRGIASSYQEAENMGPAIVMTRDDHRKTGSYGDSESAKEFRQKQKELIEAGDFLGAIQMDIDDIHNFVTPSDKYDEQIDSMIKYVNELIDKGVIIQKGRN